MYAAKSASRAQKSGFTSRSGAPDVVSATSSLLETGRIDKGSQFFSIANGQDGHDADVKKDMMRNTYQINIGKTLLSFDCLMLL